VHFEFLAERGLIEQLATCNLTDIVRRDHCAIRLSFVMDDDAGRLAFFL
jgi:hypothetical protein